MPAAGPAVPDAWLAALAGAGCGVLLGLAARLGRFCSLGAIEDAVYGGGWDRARQWIVAMGAACLGTTLLIAAGIVPAGRSIYLSGSWHPATVLLGGLMFGYGMALAGTCAFGALARLGGGDIRGFVISVMVGTSAYATISGPLAWPREALLPASLPATTLPAAAEAALGLPAVPLALTAALGLLALGLRGLPGPMAAWGVVAGVAVPLGWLATSRIADGGFAPLPVTSLSYAQPSGETLIWTMTATAAGPGFGVGSVAGVVAGAALGSLWRREFRWEACEDPRELRRQVAGAALMGAGAVLAVGCTIGAGLTGMSLLTLSAPIAVIGIVAGAVLGLRQLVEGLGA